MKNSNNINHEKKGIMTSERMIILICIAAAVLLIAVALFIYAKAKPADAPRYEDVVAEDYDDYFLSGSMWEALKAYGVPESASMSRLWEKMRSSSVKRISEYEWDPASDPYANAVNVNNARITFEKGILNGKNNVPCCSVIVYSEDGESPTSYYRLKENDWNEIKELFIVAAETGSFPDISDTEAVTDIEALEMSEAKTETTAAGKVYGDEIELCRDYLTDYISSLFSQGESFEAEKYVSDSDMLTYAVQKNIYDKRIYKDDVFHSLTFHEESAERGENNGRICLMVPYEVEYIKAYSPLSSYSGYGKAAYFEVEKADNGYRIYRALDFGAADTYATGITENEASKLKIPVEFNIESAVSALLSQKKNENITMEDYESIKIGTSHDDVIEKFGEPESSLSGMYGEIYFYGEMRIIIYYDSDSKVESVKKLPAEQ